MNMIQWFVSVWQRIFRHRPTPAPRRPSITLSFSQRNGTMSNQGLIRLDQTSMTCTAVCTDAKGHAIRPTLAWAMSPAGVATMVVSGDTQSAVFAPVADGVANITVSANGVQGVGTVTVTDGVVAVITLNFGAAS